MFHGAKFTNQVYKLLVNDLEISNSAVDIRLKNLELRLDGTATDGHVVDHRAQVVL